MKHSFKIVIFVILGFIGFTASLSALLMLLSKNYYQQTLLAFISVLGFLLSIIAIWNIIKQNKQWQKSQIAGFANPWTEWCVKGQEWEDYKKHYASDVVIKKDARLYAILATIIFIPFSFLVMFTIFDLYMLILLTLLFSALFFLVMNFVIYKANINKKLPFIKASSVQIKANGEMLLINDKLICFNMSGLSISDILVQNKDNTYSALFILDMYMGSRRLTQEHRVPIAKEKLEIVLDYISKLKSKYKIR